MVFVWPMNQTRDVHALVLPDEVTTRIAPSNLCSKPSESRFIDEGPIFLLVVVCSALENTKERQTIRETWAKDQEELNDVRVIFMLGNSFNDTLQPNVTKESEIYGDILQESFLDTYANLTVKSLMLLKWFTTSCSGKIFGTLHW